jgi:hypothetical protein
VGIKVIRSTRKLCIQGPTEGNNDIDHLVLQNKRTKSTCNPSTSRKESNNIMGYYFQNRPPSKVASE